MWVACVRLLGFARMLILQGRFEEAERAVDKARRCSGHLGDRTFMAEADAVWGTSSLWLAEGDAAVAHFRSYDAKVALGDSGLLDNRGQARGAASGRHSERRKQFAANSRWTRRRQRRHRIASRGQGVQGPRPG